MQASNVPAKIQVPFAVSGTKRTIPIPSQIGITGGAASYTDGFPPLTMTPLAGGGIPPAGQDFNGILNAITLIQQWQAAGGSFSYDATWSTANNGYPKGAVLLQAGGQGFWLCTTDNNTSNPDTGTPTGWTPLDAVGITAVTGLTNANVTLTPAQYGLPIITLAGTLTGNVQIIFPAIAGTQWLIVNNTTGAFTVTAKTSAGTGQAVPQGGSMAVWGDGANLNTAAAQGRLLARRYITSTQTYTPTSGATVVDATLVGGGGGGGGAAANGAGNCSAGAGGGGGGWAKKRFSVSAVSGLTLTIGAGGTSSAGAAGTNGGNSTFSTATATGGGGGTLGTTGPITTNSFNGSGLQGGGSGGDTGGVGGMGHGGFYASTPVSGRGGASLWGDGAPYISGTSAGNAANAPGGGGSGGSSSPSSGSAAGGAGASGIIMLEEYA